MRQAGFALKREGLGTQRESGSRSVLCRCEVDMGRRGWIAAAVVSLLVLASAARAYESKSLDEVTQGKTHQPRASEGNNPSNAAGAAREPEGVAGGDMLRVHETPLLVTAHVVDAKRDVPIARALVTLEQDGGPTHGIGRTALDGRLEARFELNDPPEVVHRPPGETGPPRVTLHVKAEGYLDATSAYETAGLPKQGRYGWIDLGDVRLRPMPQE
jgi:hypothetical protein